MINWIKSLFTKKVNCERKSFRLTDDEKENIIFMYEWGFSIDKIAESSGRSIATIYRVIRKIK